MSANKLRKINLKLMPLERERTHEFQEEQERGVEELNKKEEAKELKRQYKEKEAELKACKKRRRCTK
jgi:hypothetical protein